MTLKVAIKSEKESHVVSLFRPEWCSLPASTAAIGRASLIQVFPFLYSSTAQCRYISRFDLLLGTSSSPLLFTVTFTRCVCNLVTNIKTGQRSAMNPSWETGTCRTPAVTRLRQSTVGWCLCLFGDPVKKNYCAQDHAWVPLPTIVSLFMVVLMLILSGVK